MGWLKIGAVIAAFLALMGAYVLFGHQAREIAALKAQKAKLEGYVAGFERAQKTELEIRVTQDQLRVRVDAEKIKLSAIDPKCADAKPLVDSFVTGINRVRETGASADPGPKP